MCRCATGEAWPDIMLAGMAGRPCDERAYERNETTGTVHRRATWDAYSPDLNGSKLYTLQRVVISIFTYNDIIKKGFKNFVIRVHN
jgi:hypothetical protein